MREKAQFPTHLLQVIRKLRMTNGEIAAVLKIDRTTVSKKLNSKRPVSLAEVEAICVYLKKARGVDIDRKKVMKSGV